MMRTQNKILLKTAKFSMFPTIIRNFHLPIPSYKCSSFLLSLRNILRAMYHLNDSKQLALNQFLCENLQKQQTPGNFKIYMHDLKLHTAKPWEIFLNMRNCRVIFLLTQLKFVFPEEQVDIKNRGLCLNVCNISAWGL